jgi:autotransporter-associated beta strand protein
MIRALGLCFFVGILAVALLFSPLGGTPAARAAAKPNIVMIVSDDAGYNDFHFDSVLTGLTTAALTPNLDTLAAAGVVMKQGYTTGLLSTTARAGLLSGESSSRYGVEENLPNNIASPFGLPSSVKILPSYLKDQGYETMAVGKWHEGYTTGVNRPLDKGFDGFYGYLSGSRSYYKDALASDALLDGNTSVENVWRTQGDPGTYDPVKGRYLTDALGDKAVSYIHDHAADAQPFFLYAALPAPHSPTEYKDADYNNLAFAGLPDPQRVIAAQMLAMDRQVGNILNQLTTSGIDNNTIVVFVNDTGAPQGLDNPNYSPNAPFRGNKGFAYDGGIRVPYIIKAPGLTHGTYNSPVSTYDLLPTLYAAAGGDPSRLTTDGTNIMPYLAGTQQGDPHGELFWRNRSTWAVRKGDWKLERPDGTNVFGFYNMANTPTEPIGPNNLIGASDAPTKAKIAELYRDLTGWEATLAKPLYGVLGADDRNKFDHFVFRNNLAATTNFSAANGWQESGNLAHNVTMQIDDAYANGAIEFTTRDDASYTANNDMSRMSGLTYMLNQVQLSGTFGGGAAQSGTVGGNALLFVKNLSGQAPRIQLDATSGVAAGFTFNLNNELQLYNNLTIAGNGTQNFVINGQIRDYYDGRDPTNTTPHNVTKTGTSNVTLTANNTFAGVFTINGGQVHINGATAAISAALKITIGTAGMLALDSGSITVPTIDNSVQGDYNHDHQVNAGDYAVWRDTFGQSGANLAADGNGDGTVNQLDYDVWNTNFGATMGGALQLNGGTLKVVNITGSLTNTGGTYSPGASPALSTVGGDLHENGGSLLVEIGGTTAGSGFDQLHVSGTASLGGLLTVQLLGFAPSLGQTFQFLTADGGVAGAFSNLNLPSLGPTKAWRLLYGANDATLTIVAPGFGPGDYNHDGTVNAADYTVWRDTLGSTTNLAADGNGDNSIDAGDYDVWKLHFGEMTSSGSGAGSGATVPEPATAWLVLSSASAILLFRRQTRSNPLAQSAA